MLTVETTETEITTEIQEKELLPDTLDLLEVVDILETDGIHLPDKIDMIKTTIRKTTHLQEEATEAVLVVEEDTGPKRTIHLRIRRSNDADSKKNKLS